MKRILCITVMALLVAGAFLNPPADARNVPTILKSEDFRKLGLASFSFLKVTQSARVAGMADAFAAVANDIIQAIISLK